MFLQWMMSVNLCSIFLEVFCVIIWVRSGAYLPLSICKVTKNQPITQIFGHVYLSLFSSLLSLLSSLFVLFFSSFCCRLHPCFAVCGGYFLLCGGYLLLLVMVCAARCSGDFCIEAARPQCLNDTIFAMTHPLLSHGLSVFHHHFVRRDGLARGHPPRWSALNFLKNT